MGDRDSTNRAKLSPTLIGVLILLWLSVFLNYIDRSNLSIAAPLLKGELGLSATQLGVLLSAFFWTYACLQIPAGWLVDRFEVKWIFAGGFLIWSAATAVTGVLHSFAALLAVRVVLGMGESVAYPSYSKIIANHFPVERRGFANSIVASGLCFGQLRTAVWRNADGAVRLASFFRDAGFSELAVDWAVVDMDATSEIARG